MAKKKNVAQAELSVEDKLKALYRLQSIDSEIDKINVLRGELPLEVQDIEDEIAGLNTRISNLEEEVENLNTNISSRKNEIKEAETLIGKYKEQQNNVRNNREFDSLSKEIEYQTLEIELAEKRIKEHTVELKEKENAIKGSQEVLNERTGDIDEKKKELDNIIQETKRDEENLNKQAEKVEEIIEPRLLNAYKRIRKSARNGLGVVAVERDACGGCFNKIPPQRQLDIRSRKKIIVCEYCGRILVDPDILKEDEK